MSNGFPNIVCCDLSPFFVDDIPSPKVELTDVKPGMLYFLWKLDYSCPSIHFIITSDCGSCMNTLYETSSSTVCSVTVSTTAEMCTFAVRSIVCRNIMSTQSNEVKVMLKCN